MEEQGRLLLQIGMDLGKLAGGLVQLILPWWVVILWAAWWLWGVNWTKVWPVLAQGAWASVVLLIVTTALVWSRLAPGPCNCLGFPVGNFWWQLGAVSLVAALTLFCGWLQGVMGWAPQEVSLEPPAHSGHGHDHGHH